MSMRPAVIYCRVSTDKQTENYSLPHQQLVCQAWAQRHGIPVAGMFIENGESGKDFERPQFRAMEDRIAAGDIGWVVVSKIDRLTRSLADLSQIVDAWQDQQVILRAIEDGLDVPRADGNRLLLLFRGLMGQWERQRIVGRVIPGLQARAAAGLPLGRTPFGYKIHKTTDQKGNKVGLIVDPETAPLVRMLFARAAATGEGSRRLAAWVTSQSGRQVSYGTIGGILRNPVYLGQLRLTVGGQTTSHEASHEALVDLGTWLQVQSTATQRCAEQEAGTAHSHATSWLGGIARCGICGGKVYLRRRNGEAQGMYVCTNRLDGHPCGAAPWAQDAADTHVWDQVQVRLLADVAQVKALVTGAVELIPAELDARRQRARTILGEATAAEQRLVDDLAAGVLDAAGFEARIAHWVVRRQDAAQLLAETDGWQYLARLASLAIAQPTKRDPAVQAALDAYVRERVPSGRALVVLPLSLVLARLGMPERRHLLKAATERVELHHASQPVRVVMRPGVAAFAQLGQAMAKGLAQGDGIVAGH